MPCHHALAEALRAYIDAAGIAEDRKGWLFRTPPPRQGGRDRGGIGCHTFRATGITAYLEKGGTLENAR
jgi:hypothetical protein